MKHLCLCPSNSYRSSRAPHPAHLPNRNLQPTPPILRSVTSRWRSLAYTMPLSAALETEGFHRRREPLRRLRRGVEGQSPRSLSFAISLWNDKEMASQPHSAARSCTRVNRRSSLKFSLSHRQNKKPDAWHRAFYLHLIRLHSI